MKRGDDDSVVIRIGVRQVSPLFPSDIDKRDEAAYWRKILAQLRSAVIESTAPW